MPRTALRCIVDINLHAVTCPGVWLPRRDDVYMTVTLFNQVRRSSLTAPIFPLPFHERFRFDKNRKAVKKIVNSCFSLLTGMKVLIELIQFSDLYAGGRLLAYYEGSVRDFLYPFPSYSPTYGTTDRELLLERSLDFPGISPKLEFSTKTVIQETSAPILGGPSNGLATRYRSPSPSRSRSRSRASSRSRSRSRSVTRSSTYSRPTVSSAYRSRSVSPVSSLRRRMDSLDLAIANDDEANRPPFVVRKVSKELIGRRPGSPSPMRTSTLSSGKKKSSRFTAASAPGNRRKSCVACRHAPSTLQVKRGHRKFDSYYNYTPRYTRTYSDPESDDDLDLLTSKSPRYVSTRPRSTSPYRLYPTDSLYDEDYALRSEIIRRRIDNVLRRNRSLDRLDLYSPATYYDYRRSPYLYY
ncbi:hypothetical protein CAPTEDRAFT_184083 [Capitella teleta]|uniref:Spermatogenesis-associated protein 6 N-terminal domain-containing protein n=1 Tax=Capitella teleta TaxID=283909 RepID=R7VBJ5_CAPTE|nr:hypothetical protein CAPTEDRAFT_184083 [Capitella teleta]|eukprot:ELU16178.1 hypothetical protein CAPTEDRAFT_184083 [Capitella teleta]